MLGHESQLLTGTLCAVFHCWEWKKLSMKWKKGSQPAESHHSSSRRGPAAEGLPWVSALLTSAKLPASSRKKPRCRKSPLQPQNSLSACAESELPTAGHPPFPCNRQGTTAKSCWKTLRPRNATQTGASSQLYPLHIFL